MNTSDKPRSDVEDLRMSLACALGSLDGKERNGLGEAFKVFCAIHINRAADGFIALRDLRRDYAARMLVRPAMEAMFKLLAVKREPSLLFRIACYEHQQDEKWARPFAPGASDEHKAAFQTKWESFKNSYAEAYPDHELCESPVDLRALAAKAGVDPYYDSHYRLYCQYTHAALRATTDGLEVFSHEDERVIGFALIVAIEAVLECGGNSNEFSALREKFLATHNGESGLPE